MTFLLLFFTTFVCEVLNYLFKGVNSTILFFLLVGLFFFELVISLTGVFSKDDDILELD